MTFEKLLEQPYALRQSEKEAALIGGLNELTRHHKEHCEPYARLLSATHQKERASQMGEVPYLPVGLFKSHWLSSIGREEVFKTLHSSGTTGQQVSQIPLDRETAQRQTKALSRIMTHILGPQRLPMILVESKSLIQDRTRFSARAAGVLGMSNFGRDHLYVLDEEMGLKEEELRGYLAKHEGQPLLIFGFTFLVWQYLLNAVRGKGIDLSRAVLIHSGGWKKLEDLAVSNGEFRRQFQEETGLRRIHNFYGMVEQVGSVFVEGEDGYLHPPSFADVIIRDPLTLAEAKPGEPGLIQVLSLVPRSYPGHSILTEDVGVIETIDQSQGGKAFRVLGRIPRAELRGCSDVHASQVASRV